MAFGAGLLNMSVGLFQNKLGIRTPIPAFEVASARISVLDIDRPCFCA